MFRPSRLLAVLLLASPAAFAQPAPDAGPPPPPPPPSEGYGAPPPPPAPAGHMGPRAKFEAANTTHDGRLTQDQAQAGGMRGVARHFNEIDADHKGYVTLQDIHAWKRARHAARAAQAAPPPGPPAPPPGAPPQ